MMSGHPTWNMTYSTLRIADIRAAIAKVVARHPGMRFQRDMDGHSELPPDQDDGAWLDNRESFCLGFPLSMVLAYGDDPIMDPDEESELYWGEIYFSKGDGDDWDDETDPDATPASMEINWVMPHADEISTTLMDVVGEIASELDAHLVDTDYRLVPPEPPKRPLSWARIRSWLHAQDFEILSKQSDRFDVVLTWKGDSRTQVVTIQLEYHVEMLWIGVSSCVGTADQLEASKALEQNEDDLAQLAVDKADKRLFLQMRLPLECLSLRVLDKVIWDVGCNADVLEDHITEGKDEY
jgi:hypothetical protein